MPGQGQGWEPPDPKQSIMDDEYVIMTREAYDRMHHYDGTQPTAPSVGRWWTRGMVLVNTEPDPQGEEGWMLTRYRPILEIIG